VAQGCFLAPLLNYPAKRLIIIALPVAPAFPTKVEIDRFSPLSISLLLVLIFPFSYRYFTVFQPVPRAGEVVQEAFGFIHSFKSWILAIALISQGVVQSFNSLGLSFFASKMFSIRRMFLLAGLFSDKKLEFVTKVTNRSNDVLTNLNVSIRLKK
jgi:hypothetical protein